MSSRVAPLTTKAVNSISNTGFLNVWEGAVRSGKTVASSLAWIAYVDQSDERFFIMSGKTIAALYRNVIGGEFGMLSMLGTMGEYKVDREGNRILLIYSAKGKKICYCFGANDERSYSVLRGITAGGWYADEVSLQPRSFIEEAFRRTIVSNDRKHFWTLNPETPSHFIYTDFLDKYEEEELPGFYLWQFSLDDNLAMPEERKEELKSQFSGIFYDRYILGKRTMAAGAIYPMFNEHNLYDDSTRPYQLDLKSVQYISLDYGTTNPLHALKIRDDGTRYWVDDEYRYDSQSDEAMKTGQGQMTDSQYADALTAWAGGFCLMIIDPSAGSFKAEMRLRGWPVQDADNDVENGIRVTANLFSNRILMIHKRCKHLIRELNGYIYDEKQALKGIEAPLKLRDHGPDALRYFNFTVVPDYRSGFNKKTKKAYESSRSANDLINQFGRI